MAYEIILGRSEEDREKFGTLGTIMLGKHYVQMGQTTALAQPVYLDLNKAHVVFVCGKRGCLTGETKVYTNHGFKPIKNFDETHDKVWSYNLNKKQFEWANAKLLHYPVSTKENLVRIHFHDGQTLTMTQEHPLLVSQNDKFVWKKAKNLQVGDDVVATSHVPEATNDSKSQRIARLLGFILSDGNINIQKSKWRDGKGYWHTGTKKRIRIFNNTPQVLAQAQQDFNKEFKIKAKRYKKNNCEVVQVLHQNIVDEFIKLGINASAKAGIIRVPPVVWSHSNKFKASFLKALFSCDGFVSKNENARRITYYSNSFKFLEELQLLLLHFDIQSRIREKRTRHNNKSFTNYYLDITDYKSLKNWKKNIEFFDDEKNKRLDSFKFWRTPRRKKTKYWKNNLYTNKISAISQINNITEVYDLHVPKTHSFIANGIISHNSGKSYTLGAIAEGIATLPEEFKNKIAVIMLDTMGIYWTMKYPNHKDEHLLKQWGLEGKGIPITIFTPAGFFEKHKEEGIPTDKPFAIHPAELSPEDWNLTFDLAANDPIAVFIERAILKIKKEQGNDYDIHDILEAIQADEKEEEHVKNAAINRFKSVEEWGVFSKEATPLKKIVQGGQITVLDLSAYAMMPNGWKIKHIVIGIIAKKLFMERMAVRKNEEFQGIHSAMHYLLTQEEEEEKKLRGREMPIVWIMIDESHEFLPAQGKTAATDALVTLLREGRQPGIALVMATQQPGKIHTDAMTQSDIVLAHRLTAKVDTDALGSIIQSYLRTSLDKELAQLPRVAGAALAVDDVNERMWALQVRPRFSWHGGGAPKIVEEKKKALEF